ncbi:MAG: UbiA family prenyltransferase [Candidatus Thermoplasmatota archaeon]
MKQKLSLIERIREIAILIRIQQLGASITAVIGGLTVKGFGLDLFDFILLFVIGLIVNIGGQVHNDIKDFNIDKRSNELKERPLVKGTVSFKTAKVIILLCLISVFAIILYYFPNIIALFVIIISFIFGVIYNIYSKKLPGAELFLSFNMSLFLLFGAIVVIDDFQGLQDIGMITWVVFALTFIHVFLMNALGGGLKDAKNDRDSGAKTLAIHLGVNANDKLYIPITYKLIILLFEFSTIIFVFITFFLFDFEYSIIQLIFIILLIIFMVFSTLKLLNIKTFNRKKIMYYNRNHELAGYVLVPIVLFNIIGFFWVGFLIFFPIVWFIVFNYIFYKDSWVNPKNLG